MNRTSNLMRGVGAVAACILFAACSTSAPSNNGNTEEFPGVFDNDQQGLTQLATPCAWVSPNLTITLADGETAVVSKRLSDTAILVNGTACGAATATSAKKLTITGSTGTNTVIMDYLNGTFLAGSAGVAGVIIDLTSGSNDSVRFRMTSAKDTVSAGANGVDTTGDGIRDVTLANVDDIVASLGAGDDVFSGAGGGSLGAAFALPTTVYGSAGADTLTGGAGNDTLYGGDGNDAIKGGAGTNVLYGEAGNDTFDKGTAHVGDDTIHGGDEADAGTGSDTVTYASRTAAVTVTVGLLADAGISAADGDAVASEADDVLDDVEVVVGSTVADTLTAGLGPVTLTGGAGDDTITGGPGADVLNGGDGNDTIAGGAGNDTFNGDNGNDTFVEEATTSGADVFNGGAGTDTIDYSARTGDLTVTIDGTGNDGLSAENDNVKIDVENVIGGAGNDTITGSASDNVLTGGAGNDTLNGGAGNDTFAEGAATNGGDTFNGGAGIDTVDYSARVAAITVTMGDTTANDGLASETDNVASDVENLLGSSTAANTITGNALDNAITGGSGADTIDGAAGNDTITGGNGVNTLTGGAGNDEIFGGSGVDTMDGGAGDDILDGSSAGADVLDCGAGDADIGIVNAAGTKTNCEL